MSGSSPLRAPLVGAEDTIAAIATAQGRGALALLRLSGSAASAIAGRVIPGWKAEDRQPTLVELRDPKTGVLIDRGIVTLFCGPRSYTGEDLVEITVHGGVVVPVLLLHALLAAGARQALRGEFTRRAVVAGKMDVLQAEAVADLVDAQSRAMHQTALEQLDGRLSRHVDELRNAVLELEALIAYEIDFPEEDDGPLGNERVMSAADELLRLLDALLRTGRTGELIRQGAVVVIAGAPNAGKSSLFNALVGNARAIVTDLPGTTRDAIEAVVDLGEWPVRLVDTAGLRETDDVVERLGIEVSERYVGNADVVLGVGDSEKSLVETVERITVLTDAPVIGVRAKADLVAVGTQYKTPLVASGYQWVSVYTGEGLDALVSLIIEQLDATHGARVGETPLLTRARHYDVVARAREEIGAFRASWEENRLPAPVAAVHLHAAANALEALIGTVDVEDVLDRVFRSFCVGK